MTAADTQKLFQAVVMMLLPIALIVWFFTRHGRPPTMMAILEVAEVALLVLATVICVVLGLRAMRKKERT